MSAAPFMQLYVADYLGDTQHLTTEQHGVYLLLLMAMWRADGYLPNEPKKLARIARVSPRRWDTVAADVMEFFDDEDGQLTQKRLKQEREKVVSISLVRSHAGKAGAEAKALKNNKQAPANAGQLLKHVIYQSQKEEVSKKKPLSGVEDAFSGFWEAYPKRDGSNPRKPAFDKFVRLAKQGTDLDAITAGAQAYAYQCQATGKTGTTYVAMAVTWLNQQRWLDDHSIQPTNSNSRVTKEQMNEYRRILAE